MTEEQVTKEILSWLKAMGWAIICYDFPQSGTGYQVHLNEAHRKTKSKGSFIPDIVAFKNGDVVFFENKNRFVLSDLNKMKEIKELNNHSDGISKLLAKVKWHYIYYGVGMPYSNLNEKKAREYKSLIDFIVFTNHDNKTDVFFEKTKIF